MRRRRKLEVSTFPFLAVLLCAMGSLILVLLAMDRKAKLAAKAKAELAARKVMEEAELLAAARRAEWERARQDQRADWQRKRDELHSRLEADKHNLEGQMAALRARLAESAAELRAELDSVSDLEHKTEAEKGKLTGASKALQERRQAVERSKATSAAQQAALEKMTADLALLENTLRDLKLARDRERQTYSVVPYKGRRGESRRPLYIECARGIVIFHPDKVRVAPDRANDIRSEVLQRVTHQREIIQTGGEVADPTPYLMLLVRPDGIPSYYMFQAALRGMEVRYGYEFIDEDWILDFPAEDAPGGRPLPTIARSNETPSTNGTTATRGVIGLRPTGVPLSADGGNGSYPAPGPALDLHRPATGPSGGLAGPAGAPTGGPYILGAQPPLAGGTTGSAGGASGVLSSPGNGTGGATSISGNSGSGAGGSGSGGGSGPSRGNVHGILPGAGGVPSQGGLAVGNADPGSAGFGGAGSANPSGGTGSVGVGLPNGQANGTGAGGGSNTGSGAGTGPGRTGLSKGQVGATGGSGAGTGPGGIGLPNGQVGGAGSSGGIYPSFGGGTADPSRGGIHGVMPGSGAINSQPGQPGMPDGFGTDRSGSGSGGASANSNGNRILASSNPTGIGSPGGYGEQAGFGAAGGSRGVLQPLPGMGPGGVPGQSGGSGSAPLGSAGVSGDPNAPRGIAPSSALQPGVPGTGQDNGALSLLPHVNLGNGNGSGSGGTSNGLNQSTNGTGTSSAPSADPRYSTSGQVPGSGAGQYGGGSSPGSSSQNGAGSQAGAGPASPLANAMPRSPLPVTGDRPAQATAPDAQSTVLAAPPPPFVPGQSPPEASPPPATPRTIATSSGTPQQGAYGSPPPVGVQLPGGAANDANGDGGPPDAISRDAPRAVNSERPRKPVALRPARLTGDRDYTIYIECRADSVVLYPSQRSFPLNDLSRGGPAGNPLAQAVQQMIDRRQALVPAGQPPYRPQICFLVLQQNMRVFHLAYPALDALTIPKRRHNLDPDDDVLAIVTSR